MRNYFRDIFTRHNHNANTPQQPLVPPMPPLQPLPTVTPLPPIQVPGVPPPVNNPAAILQAAVTPPVVPRPPRGNALEYNRIAGRRIAQELLTRRPAPEAPNHRFQLMADRYRRYQTGDNLLAHDVKREAFNLLTPAEQYAFFKKLPNGQKKTDLWTNKLSPEQRIRFAGEDYMLVDQLLPAEQNEWAAAVTLQKTYRGHAVRKQLAAQGQTPFPDESTFYWANRSPELMRMKSQNPQQFQELYQAYESTGPLRCFGQPMLLHSMRRPEALDEIARRYGMRGLDWMRYMPSSFGGHTWEKNLAWMQGGMHRGLPAILTVPLDDETVVRRSLMRQQDTALHTTERGLAAYPRELLAMLPHYQLRNRADGLQEMTALPSARRITFEELKAVPATMPKETLRQTLQNFGLDVRGLTAAGGPPAQPRQGVGNPHPGQAKQLYFNTIANVDTLADVIQQFEAHVRNVMGGSDSENDQPGPPVLDDTRRGLIQQFHVLLGNFSNGLATIDTCLKACTFAENEGHHKATHLEVIAGLQDSIPVLESITAKLLPQETDARVHSWMRAFIDAKLDLLDELESRITKKFDGESTSSSEGGDASHPPSSELEE